MHRPLRLALVLGLLSTFVAPAIAQAQSAEVNVVYYSYDPITVGDVQTYALVPHTTRLRAGFGWADLQKMAFELLKRAKAGTYGLTSLYVNPDRTVSVNLDDSKRQYHPIIVGEVVYTLTELGATAVSFPALQPTPIPREEVDSPAFTLITPLWQSLPPAKPPIGLIRMPDGALATSAQVKAWIAAHDSKVITATLGFLGSKNERIVTSALASLRPLSVPNLPKHLLPLLRHPSANIRLSVVQALGGSKNPKVLMALSNVVGGDKDPRVSGMAATTLADSGNPKFASFAMFHALKGTDPKAAADAARRLGSMKEQRAVAELAKAARSGYAELRLAAVDAISAIGAVNVLRDLLSFSDIQADVKLRSASLLGQHPDPLVAQNGLVYLLQQGTGDHSAGAAAKLGETRDPKVVPWLITAIGHREPKTRVAAAQALGIIGDPRALGPLAEASRRGGPEGATMSQQVIGIMTAQSMTSVLGLSSHRDVEIRRLATESLGHHIRKNRKPASRKGIPALGRAVADFSPKVRRSAVAGLGIAGGKAALPFILQAVGDTDAEVRQAVAVALSGYKAPDGTDQVIQLLGDEEDSVRLRAIECIMARKEDKAVEPLINYSRHGNEEIKRRVFQALAAINPVRLHKTLREIFSEGVFDSDAEIRLSAVHGLKIIKDPRVLDIMSVLLQDPNLAVQMAVVVAYGESGYPQAMQPLLTLADDGPVEVRLASIEALASLGRKEAIPHLQQLEASVVDDAMKQAIGEAIKALQKVR
jgi:HEAT repeat protein